MNVNPRLLLLAAILACAGCVCVDVEDGYGPLSSLCERPSLKAVGVGDGVITTKGSTVWVRSLREFDRDFPPGSVRRHALLTHERIHAQRQFRYKGLPGELAQRAWIARYLSDTGFMWEEEQRAWYAEIKIRQKAGQWNRADTLRAASGLAGYSDLFGHPMVSARDALAWVEDVLAGRWEPKP